MKVILSFVASMLIICTAAAQVQTGKASFYADKYEGHPTASGEKYKHNKLTAAHKTLPFGTVVKVTNLKNEKSINVIINDRGPYVEGRVIDLSRRAAEELDFILSGITEVSIEIVDAGDGKSSGYPKTVEATSIEDQEFYSLKTDRKNPKGYGVQIGTFQEMVNLMRISDNLKSSYQRDVTIQVKVINGNKMYSIIIGEFRNRRKAEGLRAKVSKRYPKSFIVDYSKI